MITRNLLKQGKEVCILVRHNSPSEQLPLRLATVEFPRVLGRVLDLPAV
jgi:hypothetical protein